MLRLIVGRRYLSEDWKRLVTIVRGKTKGIALITSIREEATNSTDIFRSIQTATRCIRKFECNFKGELKNTGSIQVRLDFFPRRAPTDPFSEEGNLRFPQSVLRLITFNTGILGGNR